MTRQTIAMTRFADYVATAREIQRRARASTQADADLRPVVADLAALVMALHPEVTRTRPRRKG